MSNDADQAVINARAANTRPIVKPHRKPLIVKLIRLGFRLGGRLAPKLAGRIAYRLWFTPHRFRMPMSEQAVLDSANIEYHEINGQTIATYHWGQSGPTVLLVHGWAGRGTQLGAFVEPLINAGFRVLGFDGPAHGKSTGKQTNAFEVAGIMHALAQHYGAFEAVITHSFGGLCLGISMQRGLSPLRVVCISPPANVAGLVEKFSVALSVPKKAKNELIRRIESTFGDNIWEDISMENNVRELNIPALVIHDEHDTDVPWHEGQSIAQAWNNARFIKTSQLGHRRILRDSSTIETAVDFIKSDSPNNQYSPNLFFNT